MGAMAEPIELSKEEQAILVGTQTVIDDNPRLDVRDWTGKNPIKIVLDQKNRIPKENYIFGKYIKILPPSPSFCKWPSIV